MRTVLTLGIEKLRNSPLRPLAPKALNLLQLEMFPSTDKLLRQMLVTRWSLKKISSTLNGRRHPKNHLCNDRHLPQLSRRHHLYKFLGRLIVLEIILLTRSDTRSMHPPWSSSRLVWVSQPGSGSHHRHTTLSILLNFSSRHPRLLLTVTQTCQLLLASMLNPPRPQRARQNTAQPLAPSHLLYSAAPSTLQAKQHRHHHPLRLHQSRCRIPVPPAAPAPSPAPPQASSTSKPASAHTSRPARQLSTASPPNPPTRTASSSAGTCSTWWPSAT